MIKDEGFECALGIGNFLLITQSCLKDVFFLPCMHGEVKNK